MALADRANQYIDAHKPWVLAKQAGQEQAVQDVCSTGLNLFRVLITWLQPILPVMAQRVEAFLDIPALRWDSVEAPLTDHTIKPFTPLLTRVEQEKIDAMLEDSKEHLANTAAPAAQRTAGNRPDRGHHPVRRLREARPARRAYREGRAGRGRRQAAAADTRSGRRNNATYSRASSPPTAPRNWKAGSP